MSKNNMHALYCQALAYRKLEIKRRMDIKVHVVDPEIEIICYQAAGLQNLAHLTSDLTCPAECRKNLRQGTKVLSLKLANTVLNYQPLVHTIYANGAAL